MRHIKYILVGALIFAIVLGGVAAILYGGYFIFGPMGAPIVGLGSLILFCCWMIGMLYFD